MLHKRCLHGGKITMIQYPRLNTLLRQYRENRPEHGYTPRVDEEEKVQQVQAAINVLLSNGESITLKRILHTVALTERQLRHSPRVKALLAQYAEKRQKEAS